MAANPYKDLVNCETGNIDVYSFFQNTVNTLGNSTYFSNGSPQILPNLTLVDTDIYKWYVDIINGNIYNFVNGFWNGPIGKLGGKANVQELTFDNTNNSLNLTGGGGSVVLPAYNVSFTFTELIPTSTWNINHNMHRHPSIVIVDSSGNQFYGDIKFIDIDNLSITFGSGLTGTAYLN